MKNSTPTPNLIHLTQAVAFITWLWTLVRLVSLEQAAPI